MLELFNKHRWILDILDISIMSLILYRFLLFIKGTKAVQMLLGLCALLAASIASHHLELFTTDLLVQNLWAQIVPAIIVLFQPEIRTALALMGEVQIFSFLTAIFQFKPANEIFKASIALSNRKIGALMIIARESSLKEYIEFGIPLDAEVSKELLRCIFHPTSPIHDGSVIIKRNRIAAAGCFVPITRSLMVNKSLGSRHRAGVGITEESDAVSIILSEETGSISIAVGGKLEYNLDEGTLKNRLAYIFAVKKETLG